MISKNNNSSFLKVKKFVSVKVSAEFLIWFLIFAKKKSAKMNLNPKANHMVKQHGTV